MGWQDRDYARRGGHARPVWAHGPGYGYGHGALSIVTVLIFINVGIYVLGAMFPPIDHFLKGSQRYTPFGIEIQYGIAELWGEAVMRGQVWRLFTAQYLHAGVGHLFINMLVLHFLGRPLEGLWSARKFFTIYTLAGLAGNIFFTLLTVQSIIDPRLPAVGASGCIYGLLGIVAVLFPHATVYVYFLFPIKIRTAAIIFGGIAFLTIIARGPNFGGEACHLAGLVFGVWWGMKGDTWWQRVRRRLPSLRNPGRSGAGATFRDKMAQRKEDAETIDRILRKVYDGGIHSLTEAEKRALQEATERQRARDREAGRVDRL